MKGGGDTCKVRIFSNLVTPALRTIHIINIVSRHEAEGPEVYACRALWRKECRGRIKWKRGGLRSSHHAGREQDREDTGLEEALTIRSDDVSLSRAHPAVILLIFLAQSFTLECLAPCPTLGKLNINKLDSFRVLGTRI